MEIQQEYELVPRNADGVYEVEGKPSLRPHPQNPNRGQIGEISESIDVNGWYGVITVQASTGYILAGNHRFFAAAGQKAAAIPVVWRDVDDEGALRILLADNEIARHAETDADLVQAILDELGSVRGTGYVDAALDGLAEALEADDPEADAEGDEEPDVVPDDVYTPTYGVMIVCTDEEMQAEVYDLVRQTLKDQEDATSDLEIRVVAV